MPADSSVTASRDGCSEEMVGTGDLDDGQSVQSGDPAWRYAVVLQAGGYSVVAQESAKQVDCDTAMSDRNCRTGPLCLFLEERLQP